jgi:hypothetical protein
MNIKLKKYKTFRIRLTVGYKGGSNIVYHADIRLTHYKKALSFAKQHQFDGKINWRWIDTYDTSREDYIHFQYLGMVK